VEGLFDTLTLHLRYLPVSVLHLLITTSQLSPEDQVALNVSIFTALTSKDYIDYTQTTPMQSELEQLLLPHRARSQSFAENAKVSLILEQVFMSMMEPLHLEYSTTLRGAVEHGIKERSNVKGKKDNLGEDKVGEALLMKSSERLRGLVEMLEMLWRGKMPTRDSPRKKSTSNSVLTCNV
jgi:hypothetical protein